MMGEPQSHSLTRSRMAGIGSKTVRARTGNEKRDSVQFTRDSARKGRNFQGNFSPNPLYNRPRIC